MILAWVKRCCSGYLAAMIIGVVFFTGYGVGAYQTDTRWLLKWTRRDADDATALARRQISARVEEQRQQGEINAIEKHAAGSIAQAVSDADRARAESARLHDETAKLAARLAASERARHAATARTGAPDSPASDLFAGLFRRADQRAGELAAIADQARIRGLSCEAAYDALTGAREVER